MADIWVVVFSGLVGSVTTLIVTSCINYTKSIEESRKRALVCLIQVSIIVEFANSIRKYIVESHDRSLHDIITSIAEQTNTAHEIVYCDVFSSCIREACKNDEESQKIKDTLSIIQMVSTYLGTKLCVNISDSDLKHFHPEIIKKYVLYDNAVREVSNIAEFAKTVFESSACKNMQPSWVFWALCSFKNLLSSAKALRNELISKGKLTKCDVETLISTAIEMAENERMMVQNIEKCFSENASAIHAEFEKMRNK